MYPISEEEWRPWPSAQVDSAKVRIPYISGVLVALWTRDCSPGLLSHCTKDVVNNFETLNDSTLWNWPLILFEPRGSHLTAEEAPRFHSTSSRTPASCLNTSPTRVHGGNF